MIVFKPIASGSSGCAYAVGEKFSNPLLLDCGISLSRIQSGIGFGLATLAGCLLTHAHGDHSYAAKDILARGVKTCASFETIDQLGIKSPFWRPVEAGKCYQLQSWKITPFNAVHDSPGTLGFVIDSAEGSRLLYLTDSGYSSHTFNGLTHIAIECNHSEEILRRNTMSGNINMSRFSRTTTGHMSLERLTAMLKANDLSQVREIHLLHLSDANSDEAKFKETIQRVTGKPVYVAQKNEVTK